MRNILILLILFFLSITPPLNGRNDIDPMSSSDIFFQSAGVLFDQNKKASAKQFQSFIKHYPKDNLVPEAAFMIGECFFDPDPTSLEALKKFQKVVDKYSSSTQSDSAALRTAEIYYNRKDYLKSLQSLERVESRYSNGHLRHEIQFLKAKCYIVLKNFPEAEKILSLLISERPIYKEDKRFNYIFGLVNYQLEKDDLALENLEKVDLPEAFLFSSKVLVRMKKPLLAIEKLKDLTNKYPENILQERADFLIGEAFFAAKDYTSAIYNYEKFLQIYTQSNLRGAAIYKIGCSYLESGNYLQARSNFQSFLQIEPQSEFAPLAVYLIGESFIREKRFKEACFAYGDMVSSYPDNFYTPNAQYKLGWCHFNLSNWKLAKSSLIQFRQLFPNHPLLPHVDFVLGNSLNELELYPAAAVAYQRVIDQTRETELKEAALALMIRANYLSEDYTPLVSGYRFILNRFSPSKSPWRLITYLYLAEGYLKQGLYREAIELYKLIQSVYPTSPLLIYAYDGDAWANFLNETYTEARDIREKIQRISQQKDLPGDFLLINQYELANILFNQKKYLKALDIFEIFRKQNPEHYLAISSCFRAGLCYYQLEYFGQAIESWEGLATNYPDAPEAKDALWKAADTYFRAQSYDKSIQIYERMLTRYIKDDKESAKAYLRIAQCYYNSKNNILAVQSLTELIKNFPAEPQAYEALDFLTTFLETPDFREPALAALKTITNSLGRKTAFAIEVRFRLARNFFENKEYAKTIEMLEGLISELFESERFADSSYYLAESYYQLGKFDKAAPIYERFVDNFPENKRIVFVLFRLGSTQFKIEKFGEATVTFEKLVNKYPDTEYSAAATYNTAIAYKELGEWEKAAGTLQIYQKKYPQEAVSQGVDMELAAIYDEQNQYLQAIEILKTKRNEAGEETETWRELTFHIAENYIALGKEEEGLAEYQKLTSTGNPLLDSWTLHATIKLAEYYEKNQQQEKALSLYEKLYDKAVGMPAKPSWFGAVKSYIEAIRLEIKK